MARFKDESIIVNAFGPHLQPGERLLYYAYGVKPPNILFILLTGIIFAALFTKEYAVGLTDRGRFLVLRFSGKMKVKEVLEYQLGEGVAKVSTGPIFTHIRIDHPQKPFVAKFHRMGLKFNREQSMAIAQALQTRQLPAAQPA